MKIEQPNLNQEKKLEFSFEEGVTETLKRIREILQEKETAVVAFSASSSNVGKTTLSKRIMSELYKVGISSFTIHTIHALNEPPLRNSFTKITSSFVGKFVLIIDQCDWGVINSSKHESSKAIHNENLRKALLNTKYEKTDKIDLWIGISTADKPFNTIPGVVSPLADILIKNEFAIPKNI